MTTQSATDLLLRHIAAFQDSFPAMSKASGVRDLAGRFTGFMQKLFPDDDVNVLFRAASSDAWQRLSGKDERHVPPPEEEPSQCDTVLDGGKTLKAVRKLVDGSLACITVTAGNHQRTYATDDLIPFRLSVNLFDQAYHVLVLRKHEKDLVFSLNHRLLQLNSLIDTGIDVAKLDRDVSPQRLALERAVALTNASRGMVEVTCGADLVERMMFPETPAHGDALNTDSRIRAEFSFGGRQYGFELFNKESRSGLIPFEPTDQLLLDALARQVEASLENRFLLEQSLEKQKIEQDIAVAASIQQRILPATLPTIAGYDLAGINIPSKSVGGDYFDCIPLADGRYALVVADVAGKGVPAALLVSSLHAYLSAYLEGTQSLVELARKLNTVICRASTEEKFITAFFALLAPTTGEIETLNAGHNPAYLLRTDGAVEELTRGGLALGMLELDLPFETEHVVLGCGERLLLYTDGIPEAANAQNELYESRTPLREFVARDKSPRAGDFIQGLMSDIQDFTGDAAQRDDITALYLIRM